MFVVPTVSSKCQTIPDADNFAPNKGEYDLTSSRKDLFRHLVILILSSEDCQSYEGILTRCGATVVRAIFELLDFDSRCHIFHVPKRH